VATGASTVRASIRGRHPGGCSRQRDADWHRPAPSCADARCYACARFVLPRRNRFRLRSRSCEQARPIALRV
jgi:hypothetical protein